MLSETHTTSVIEDNELELPNYNLVKLNSESNRTGGVLMYLKKEWQYEIIQSFTIGVNIWWLAIKCVRDCISFVVVTVYRSPNVNSTKRKFCEFFKEWMESIEDLNINVIIAGDFNINWAEQSTYKNDIQNIIMDNGFRQQISDFTRITQASKTVIDYVITNMYNVSTTINNKIKISDHETIQIEVKHRHPILKSNDQIIEVFKYNHSDFENELKKRKINSVNYINDINESANEIDRKVKEVMNKFKIKKTIKTMNTNEWYNAHMFRLKEQKVWLYEKARLSTSEEDWCKYRSVRNSYKLQIERAKNKFIQDKIINAGDQKQMWRVIKRTVLKESKTIIKSIKFDNEIVSNNSISISNKLNEYFINSVNDINKSITIIQYVNHINQVHTQFKFKYVNINELKSICKEMNKKKDYNGISTKLIYENWSIFGEVLETIFNKSIRLGEFPKCWKESLVIPIQKIKNTIKCEEFRPINVLPTIEKMFEKVIQKQVESYFESNNIIIKEQSGFRKNHTCETALNWLIIEWKENIEKKKTLYVRYF